MNGKGGFRSDEAKPWEHVVLEVARRKKIKLALDEEAGAIAAIDWSPDGKRMAYLQKAPGNEYKVIVSDTDGKNAREVYKAKAKGNRAFVMWR